MKLHDAIAWYAPGQKHLIGIVPDDELAARVTSEMAEDLVEPDEMYSHEQYSAAVDDAEEEGKEHVREDVHHVLDNMEWSTAEELAKLIREAIE